MNDADKSFVRLMPGVSFDMLSPSYWYRDNRSCCDLIMNSDDIEGFNTNVRAIFRKLTENNVKKLCRMNGKEIRAYVESFVPESSFIINSNLSRDKVCTIISKKMPVLADYCSDETMHGVTVNTSAMKLLPSDYIVSDEPDDKETDLLQESLVPAFEPVLVLFGSNDDNWIYCVTDNSAGWMRSGDVALFRTRNEWEDYCSSSFMTVLSERLSPDDSAYFNGLGDIRLTMGCRIVIEQPSSANMQVLDRSTYMSYIARIPVRTLYGQAEFKKILIPYSADVSHGYLPLTLQNLFNQCFKLLGRRYGWGGLQNARDCSSFISEVYRCFGLCLPRNSKDQAAMDVTTVSFTGMDKETRRKTLMQISPGTLLYFEGHIMIYLGNRFGSFYVINALGCFGEFNSDSGQFESRRVRSIVINDLGIRRPNGNTWIEELQYGKTVW